MIHVSTLYEFITEQMDKGATFIELAEILHLFKEESV